MWAVQYHRPGRGDGVVQVCKREHCPYVTVAFPLRGVDETARYRFVDADDCFGGSDGSDDAFTVSGKALMEEGLTLTIPGKRVAKVYFYEKV